MSSRLDLNSHQGQLRQNPSGPCDGDVKLWEMLIVILRFVVWALLVSTCCTCTHTHIDRIHISTKTHGVACVFWGALLVLSLLDISLHSLGTPCRLSRPLLALPGVPPLHPKVKSRAPVSAAPTPKKRRAPVLSTFHFGAEAFACAQWLA